MNCEELLLEQVSMIASASPGTTAFVYRNAIKALPWCTFASAAAPAAGCPQIRPPPTANPAQKKANPNRHPGAGQAHGPRVQRVVPPLWPLREKRHLPRARVRRQLPPAAVLEPVWVAQPHSARARAAPRPITSTTPPPPIANQHTTTRGKRPATRTGMATAQRPRATWAACPLGSTSLTSAAQTCP